MLSKVYGAGLLGTEGVLVCCEANVENGFPQITVIGSLSSAAREAVDRIRTAASNSGIHLEPKHVTINLSPADFRKEGCGYDLPIAASLLSSYGLIPEQATDSTLMIGELSLGGEVLSVPGVISMVCAARDAGLTRCFVPRQNLREASVIRGIECYGVSTLSELLRMLRGEQALPEPAVYQETEESASDQADFGDVTGQDSVKRATVLAVAGRHNLLYVGSAGSGKSMLATRIPNILPGLTIEERIQIAKVYSVSGLLSAEKPLPSLRPFRAPHHTITAQGMAGGGANPKPGEISLASAGVLFLDELPEFRAETLEILRQPMEEKCVHISRLRRRVDFPADFQLICAMNPCKCGFYPDRTRCRCSESRVQSYLNHISRPLLDRIDLCVETRAVPFHEIYHKKPGKENDALRRKVEAVRRIQERRFQGSSTRFNSEMNLEEIKQFCQIRESEEAMLEHFYRKNNLSARGLHKLLKVSRTIADFENSQCIRREHLCEAIAYRALEFKYWTPASASEAYEQTSDIVKIRRTLP